MKHIFSIITMLGCWLSVSAQTEAYIADLRYRLMHEKDAALAETCRDYARTLSYESKMDSAFIYYDKMELIAEKIRYAKGLRYANSGKGATFLMKNDPEKAISYFLKAIDLAEKSKDTPFIACMRANIGLLKFNLGEQQIGLKMMLDALPDAEKSKDTFDIIAVNGWICECYMAINDLKKGIIYHNRAMEMYEKMMPEKFISHTRQFRLGAYKNSLEYRQAQIYYNSEDYEKAITAFEKLLVNNPKLNDAGKAGHLSYIAYAWLKLKQPKKCLLATERALANLKKDSSAAAYQSIYGARSVAFRQMGNYKAAIAEYDNWSTEMEKNYEFKIKNKTQSLQSKYETEKKDKEIDYLKNQRKLNGRIITVSIAAAAIALFAFLLAIRSKKLKEKLFTQNKELLVSEREREKKDMQLQLLELEQMALRAQMNPHFIFNCLNSVQYYVIKQDLQGANKYISILGSIIRLTLDFSSKPVILLSEDLDYMRKYMELEKMRMQDKFSYTISIDDDIDCTELYLPPLLLQPFIENSIIHGIKNLEGRTGLIEIGISRLPGTIKYTITDNGVGREMTAKFRSQFTGGHQSKGLELTRKRIELLGKKDDDPVIQIEDLKNSSGKAAGTKVIIILPDDL